MQRAWIGKSTGTVFGFRLDRVGARAAVLPPSGSRVPAAGVDRRIDAGNGCIQDPTVLDVFTTRPETLFGVTFLAVSPDHDDLDKVRLTPLGALSP